MRIKARSLIASEGNLGVQLVFAVPVISDVFDQPGLDVVIVQELREDLELLGQELVGHVHLFHSFMIRLIVELIDPRIERGIHTVVFMIPVPWVRMEFATWRILMVFRC